MEDNYSKAYKEIVEILKYVPEESVNKIPKEMRDMFEAEQLKTYNFQIDTEKPFEEQEILEETKAILANIFRDYWATDEQKARIIEKENNEEKYLITKVIDKFIYNNLNELWDSKDVLNNILNYTKEEFKVELKELSDMYWKNKMILQ